MNMKNKMKRIMLFVVSLPMVLILTACSGLKSLDVVGQYSVSSFEKILKTIPDQVSVDELNGGYRLSAPDESVHFIWSEDYSGSPVYDVMLELDAQPFLDAGLDLDKLPDNYRYEEAELDGESQKQLKVGMKLGDDKLTYDGDSTASTAYEQIVDQYRDVINYHTQMDHFGVMLGDGNMFEWAKDMEKKEASGEKQDLDIVFALNPEPLIAAGVEAKDVKGWSYAPVETMKDGKMVEVMKFLKPFDLK